MSLLKPHDRSRMLSAFLDGVLSDAERRDVESWLASDAEAREELAQLRRLQTLLGSRNRLEPDIGFWTRLSVRFEEERRESRNLLPFPRKYVPAVASALTVVVAICGFLLVKNRMPVLAFFSKQTQTVRKVYEQGILKGSVLPLFASVDKDRALQFSLFGELALDDRSKTALRVDEKANNGYSIEVGKSSKRAVKPVTFDRFVSEIQPTPGQRRVIDSLLGLAQDRIASSVLVGEDNTFAIDPELPRLNRVMVTGIASCLEPPQRRRLERLLAQNSSPYAVSADRAVRTNEVFPRLEHRIARNRFMIVTPDTTMFSEVQIDFDSLRRAVEVNMARFQERQQAMLDRMQAGEFRWMSRPGLVLQHRPVAADSDYFRVDFTPALPDLPGEFHVLVSPRDQGEMMTREFDNGQVHIRIFQGQPRTPDGRESPAEVELQVDSLRIKIGGIQRPR